MNRGNCQGCKKPLLDQTGPVVHGIATGTAITSCAGVV